MFRLDDTIIAVSSPPGQSLRGLLRLSGPGTLAVVQSLIDQPLPQARCLTAMVIHFDAASGEKHLSLPVFLTYWRGPGSFTGQDSAEIQCPGHPALLERLLQQAMDFGARLAGPGEFTFRAFMHGKMDLTQAEGVAATIAATGHAELAAARHLCAGELGQWSRALVDRVANLLALVEAGIDFTDQEDVVLIAPAQALIAVRELRGEVESLRQNSLSWKQLEALPRVVLAGPPSVGKSTLFNRLLGQDRAVTHDAPGTTRDVLAEPLTLTSDTGNPVEVMLVDVAGLDSIPENALSQAIQDHVAAQAQQAAKQAISEADVLLILHHPRELDASHPRHGMPASFAESAGLQALHADQPIVHLLAQSDLWQGLVPAGWLPISALRGDGLQELRQRLMHIIGQRGVSLAGDKLALQPRHEAALAAASSSLFEAERLLEPQADAAVLLDLELVAGHLRLALDELACLGGSLSPDEVLGRVFARFCIGK